MIIEVIREEQRKYYASFKKLANNPKTKPEAVRVAQSRLRSAGILDKAGKLANPLLQKVGNPIASVSRGHPL